MSKPRGLGRGLDVLLPTNRPAPAPAAPPAERSAAHPSIFECALERIVPNRTQPRQDFDEARLEELAESIRQHGLIEPLVVRRIGNEDRFEIVAGERRWRASQRAGLREVPVCIAKTQYSFSDDPNKRGRPTGFNIHVREVTPSAGAGFVVAICGDLMTMPGLPRQPAAELMSVDVDGNIHGLS